MEFARLRADGRPEGNALAAESRAIPGEELWWPPGTTAGMVVTPETALHSAPILTAHITVAMDTGITPMRVMREQADGSAQEERAHYLKPLLRRTPDGIRTPSRFRAALMGHALGHRGGFAEIVRRGDGRPGKLVLLDPRLTTYQAGATGRPGYRSGTGWLPADDVLHVAGFGFDGLNGYQIPYLIAQAVGVTLGAESYAADFFANGSDPGGVIELPGKFDSKEKLEQFRAGFEDRHQGPGKRHRQAVIQNGGKWVRTGTDPEAAQLTETRKYQATDSTRPYRVPPHKYGDYSEAHLANLDASNVDYLQSALMSWFVGLEEEFSLKLLSEREWLAGYRLAHDLEALLRGDPLKRYQCHEIAVRNGWRSRNDVRRREGDAPIPAEAGGDLYTIQQQVIPLAMSGRALAGPDPDAAKEPDPDDPNEAAENEPPHGRRAALRFNPNHDPRTGRFTGRKGSGPMRGGAALPAKIRGDEHAALVSEQRADRRELGSDLRSERRELQQDQAREAKDLQRDQAKESRGFAKDQAREGKDFEREQARDAKDLARRQQAERDEMARDIERGDRDPSDATDLQQTHATDRADHDQAAAAARDEFRQAQAQAARDFADQQAADRADLAESQQRERTAQREYHRERINEMVETHRADQAELLRDLRERRR